MAARLLLLVILLIFSVTILNWFKLGQFLTVSPPLAPDQQKNEFHRQNEDERLVENIENPIIDPLNILKKQMLMCGYGEGDGEGL